MKKIELSNSGILAFFLFGLTPMTRWDLQTACDLPWFLVKLVFVYTMWVATGLLLAVMPVNTIVSYFTGYGAWFLTNHVWYEVGGAILAVYATIIAAAVMTGILAAIYWGTSTLIKNTSAVDKLAKSDTVVLVSSWIQSVREKVCFKICWK